LVVAGGVIPPQDYDFLYNCGVSAVFGPGKWTLLQPSVDIKSPLKKHTPKAHSKSTLKKHTQKAHSKAHTKKAHSKTHTKKAH